MAKTVPTPKWADIRPFLEVNTQNLTPPLSKYEQWRRKGVLLLLHDYTPFVAIVFSSKPM